MSETQENLKTLQEIRNMMEKSSRFISLSGWSGVAAGACALAGASLSYPIYNGARQNGLLDNSSNLYRNSDAMQFSDVLKSEILWIAIVTLIAAVALASLFTWLRSRKNGTPIWGTATRRLLINTCIPLVAGGFFLLKIILNGAFGLIAPACLVFYGLALVNGSKYTIGEIRYLGFGQIILGIVNLWQVNYGLYFWAMGFGLLHIIYGIAMWLKYERNPQAN